MLPPVAVLKSKTDLLEIFECASDCIGACKGHQLCEEYAQKADSLAEQIRQKLHVYEQRVTNLKGCCKRKVS